MGKTVQFFSFYFISLFVSDNCIYKSAERRGILAGVLNIILIVGHTHSFFRPLGHHLV